MNQTLPKKYLSLSELEQKAKEYHFDVNLLLKEKGYQNKPLDFEQAYLLGAFALSPYIPKLRHIFDLPRELVLIQSVVALSTFHNRATYQQENSAEQIAGICAAVFDYDIGTSKSGFIHTSSTEVVDNCGMGGDLFKTPNLSTIAALIASADGVKMLKHGSPGNTDNVGSSDFLAYCGVNLFPEKKIIEEAITTFNFAYTDALDENYKRIHTQTHNFAKIAHMNDIIGPITNPVNPSDMHKRILGINHLIQPVRVAEAYRILNEKRVTSIEQGIFVRGFANEEGNGGIDEVSIMPGGTLVSELKNGQIKNYHLSAKDFGLNEINVLELNPGKNKAETSRRILSREITDGKMEAALANAAIIFYLTEGLSFKEGADKAREILASGKPYEVLQEYAHFSRGD